LAMAVVGSERNLLSETDGGDAEAGEGGGVSEQGGGGGNCGGERSLVAMTVGSERNLLIRSRRSNR
jgi:hypothetical protein